MTFATLVSLAWTMTAQAGAAVETGAETPAAVAVPAVMHQPPVIKALPAVKVTKPARFTLPSGLAVQAVPRHVSPIVVLTVSIQAGSAADPTDKDGLAAATADMMDEGAGSRSALELARDLETLGASMSINANRDGSRLTLRTPVAGLPRALALLGDVLAAPRFDEAEWKRVRHDRVTSLVQRRDEPTAAATVVAGRVIYGDGHPYAHPADGYVRTLEAITRDDLAAFHKTHWVPGAATLIAAGDFQVAALKTALTTALARWKTAPVTKVPAVSKHLLPAQRPRLVLVDRPGAPQTVVRFIGPGLPRRSALRPALTLASTILGGSFTSRLNSNLREEKGYTYGAFGGFNFNRDAGTFLVSADVFTKVTGPAVEQMLKEVSLIRAQPLTSAELTKARAIDLVSVAEALSTTPGIAGLFGESAVMGEPPDAAERFMKALAGKDAGAVKSAVADHVDPQTLSLVVVGDRSAIEAPLRALGFPPPELRDADGDPVP
jgi:zinc protease